jgi:hypothetical protein
MRRAITTALAASLLVAVLYAAPAFAQPGSALDEHVPPNKDEMAGIGCMAAGTAAAIAAATLGVMTVAVTGGAAASYANLALPVVGTAFAAGCGVGVLAAPGAAWLVDHYVLGGRRDIAYRLAE